MKWYSHISFRRAYALIALVLVVMLAVPLTVFADTVVNTIDTTVDPALETVTITAGGPGATVGFYMAVTNGTPSGDPNGCNSTGSDPATVNLSVPAEVSATSSSLTFIGCGLVQNLTFSSGTAGSYSIIVASVTGGKPESLWDTAPASFTLVVEEATTNDTTAPTTTASVSPTPNAVGWNNTDVTVTLSATDNEGGTGVNSTYYMLDGAAQQTYSAPFTISTEGIHTLEYWSVDNASNVETHQTATIKIDKTPPTINCTVPDQEIWYPSDVTVNCTASDTPSGLANTEDGSASLYTNVGAGAESASASTGSKIVYDAAGNYATAGPYTFKVDMKAPVITINAPTDASYLLNEVVTADYKCTDGGSGVKSCVGTVTNGTAIDASSVGVKTFTVDAEDNVRNKSSLTLNYSVIYDWGGFLPPIKADGTSVLKLGSTVPVKFWLKGGSAGVSTAGGAITVAKVTNDVAGDAVDGTSTSAATTGNLFRYDSTSDQYVFNLATKGLEAGTYQIKVVLNDDMSYTVNIELR